MNDGAGSAGKPCGEEDLGSVGQASPGHLKRNAFEALMAPKAKKSTTVVTKGRTMTFPGADGLGAYVENPSAFPLSQVIYWNDDFVAINDKFPKSSVHTLLIPRDPRRNCLHPFEAFEDREFLQSVLEEVRKLRRIVAKELQRIHGKYSVQDEARERILNGEDTIPDDQELPEGRDWEKEVIAGIHAHPSMHHLHVHVMSVDRHSPCLKHRKHYNSFSTAFFVDIEDFPLEKGDARRHPGKAGYLNSEFRCWRCSRNFGSNFKSLKQHLTEEFESWRQL